MDNIQAGVLNIRLKDINEIWDTRKKFAEMYDKGLDDCFFTLPTPQEGRVYQEYVIQVVDRLGLTEHLTQYGIEVLPSLKQQTTGLKENHLLWSDKVLPETKLFTEQNLRLPIWPTLKEEDIEYVITTIKNFYGV